jgi:hypothetical protein
MAFKENPLETYELSIGGVVLKEACSCWIAGQSGRRSTMSYFGYQICSPADRGELRKPNLQSSRPRSILDSIFRAHQLALVYTEHVIYYAATVLACSRPSLGPAAMLLHVLTRVSIIIVCVWVHVRPALRSKCVFITWSGVLDVRGDPHRNYGSFAGGLRKS